METKKCTECKKVKELKDFSKRINYNFHTKEKFPSFINSYCKKCMIERMKKWRLNNLEKYRTYQLSYWHKKHDAK